MYYLASEWKSKNRRYLQVVETAIFGLSPKLCEAYDRFWKAPVTSEAGAAFTAFVWPVPQDGLEITVTRPNMN